MKHWVIYSKKASENDIQGDPLFWNNADGWGCLATANVYSEAEKASNRLPTEGEWVELPEMTRIALEYKKILEA